MIALYAGPAAAWAQGRAQTQDPPNGQGSGSGPDHDDLVVTHDHDIPRVSDSPKSILTSLNLSNLNQESLCWALYTGVVCEKIRAARL